MYRRALCTAVWLSVWVVVRSDTVTVTTSLGDIVGQSNDGYNTFFGVPYARVNESNPFGKYLEQRNFDTPLIANESSTMCPQVTRYVGGTLQCLNLNIYVPNTANSNNKLPIMVWFNGGGLLMGYAGLYGGEHLVKHDIIVVTVNYRLGVYGFLCLDDPDVPGNQGMKDQIAALRWVKQNIGDFGGDADKVTIAGESYGGGAVDLHLYSKYETLFNKAIIQSGSIFTNGFYMKPDYEAPIKIANYLGLNVTSTQEALTALSTQEPLNVAGAASNLGLRFTICKEKNYEGVQNFVDKDPFHLDNPERVNSTALLLGYNSKEDFATYANKTQEYYDSLGDIFYTNLNKSFDFEEAELTTLSSIIRKFYLGGKDIAAESASELSDYGSDFKLSYAAEWSVDRYVEQGASVYKYMFSYIGGSAYQNMTGAGAIHTAELPYLFEMDTKLTSDEQIVIRDRMTTMWSQFVKYGNPTPEETSLLPVSWTAVSGAARPYLNIDVEMSMQDYVYQHRNAFWNLFWHNYVKNSIVYNP